MSVIYKYDGNRFANILIKYFFFLYSCLQFKNKYTNQKTNNNNNNNKKKKKKKKKKNKKKNNNNNNNTLSTYLWESDIFLILFIYLCIYLFIYLPVCLAFKVIMH